MKKPMSIWQNKKKILYAVFFLLSITPPVFSVQTEKVTTYYSQPNGDYKDVTVINSLTVGGNMQASVGTGNFSILNNDIDGWVTSFPAPSGGGLTVVNSFNIQNSANTSLFYVDNVNHRVGIGTATPLTTLDVRGEVNTQILHGYSTITDPWSGASVETLDQNFETGGISGNILNGFAGVTTTGGQRFIYIYIDADPLILQSIAKSGAFRGPVAMNLDPDDRATANLNPLLSNTNLIVGGATTPKDAYATSWTIGSSRELKTDISAFSFSEYQDSLNKLASTTIYRYHFKNEDNSRKAHIGFIAEEAPDNISTKDKKAIDIGDTIGFLIASVKSLKEEQDGLEKAIEALKK